MLDLIVGTLIIAFCLGACTALVFHSRRRIRRISRLKSSTYRDILREWAKRRNG